MKKAINETIRRRRTQEEYNRHHGITPTSIKKAIRESRLAGKKIEVEKLVVDLKRIPKEELPHILEDLRNQMDIAAKNLEFEKAAALRDEISALKDALGGSIRKRVTRR